MNNNKNLWKLIVPMIDGTTYKTFFITNLGKDDCFYFTRKRFSKSLGIGRFETTCPKIYEKFLINYQSLLQGKQSEQHDLENEIWFVICYLSSKKHPPLEIDEKLRTVTLNLKYEEQIDNRVIH